MRCTLHSLRLAGPLSLFLFAVVGLQSLSAQSAGVPASEAEDFMGQWALPIDSGQGMINLTIDIQDSDGQVAVEVASDMGTPPDTVSRISKSGASLILNWDVNAQGQLLPIQLTLTPSGDDLAVAVDAADGMFVIEGTATRQ